MYYLYKIGHFLSLSLPLKAGYAIATFLASVYYFFSITDKKALKDNIRIVLNTDNDKLCDSYARKVFINFAKYLIDFFRLDNIGVEYIKEFVTIEGIEHVDEALKKKKGAILLSSHIGNWELGAAVLSQIGYPVYVIALDHAEKKVNDFFIKQRNSKGVGVIPIGTALRQCFKVLKENKTLGILGDRDFSEKGERVKFFGRETLMPKGPAIFSLRTGAPIVPTFMLREKKGRFRFVFEKPINYELTSSEEVDKKNIIESYLSVIERYIKKYPDQWYVFRNVWNES